MVERMKREWFGNVRADILSGIVVALALIPEAIAFSIIAGVDPMVGLYASFCIAVIIAFVGGRPGMISAATGGIGAGSFGERLRFAVYAGSDCADRRYSDHLWHVQDCESHEVHS